MPVGTTYATMTDMLRLVYYRDSRGREPVREYIDAIERHGDHTALAVIRRELQVLATEGPILGFPHEVLIVPKSGIRELRPGDHRIAYALFDGEIVILHAWRKRTRKLDERQARRAELNFLRYADG